MAQILDPLPPQQPGRILCCYVNATSKIQVARICDVPNWYFERVVFPGQRLVFEAPSIAHLEIHTGMMASAILSDKIPCDRLSVNEDPNYTIAPTQTTGNDTTNKTQMVQTIKTKSESTTKALTVAGFTSVD